MPFDTGRIRIPLDKQKICGKMVRENKIPEKISRIEVKNLRVEQNILRLDTNFDQEKGFLG